MKQTSIVSRIVTIAPVRSIAFPATSIVAQTEGVVQRLTKDADAFWASIPRLPPMRSIADFAPAIAWPLKP
jgi:hypothetical protein